MLLIVNGEVLTSCRARSGLYQGERLTVGPAPGLILAANRGRDEIASAGVPEMGLTRGKSNPLYPVTHIGTAAVIRCHADRGCVAASEIS
jgi:hypothetical protein